MAKSFSRKVRRRRGLLAGGAGVVGLRRGHERGRLDLQRSGQSRLRACTVRAGETTQFSARVTGNANQSVTWSVNGVPTGNSTVGSIDATGKYRAPSSLPSPQFGNDLSAAMSPTRSLSASTSVTLQNPIPVAQIVSPTFLPVGNFSLTVGGANFVSGSKVMFGGKALTTTYVGSSQLKATGTATAAQVGTVKITVENPDPGKSSSQASLNVQVGAAGQVTVQVVPPTAQITAGSTFQYRASVSGSGANTAVQWAVNGIPGGNATVGTISTRKVSTMPHPRFPLPIPFR